ncbi:hypothetical protein HDG35_003858 [Paraburkholderia sp. JPY681]|nr:hypothetical protein [Paraburkholderia atlantica]
MTIIGPFSVYRFPFYRAISTSRYTHGCRVSYGG